MIHWSLSFLSVCHIFSVNITKDEGRNGNILPITRKQSSRGVLQNKDYLKCRESALESDAEELISG